MDKYPNHKILKIVVALTIWNTIIITIMLIFMIFLIQENLIVSYDEPRFKVVDYFCSSFGLLCNIGDTAVFPTKGISMEPTLYGGTRYNCTRMAEYGINDIITFYKRGKIIAHRIIGRNGERFITKGDNIATTDNWYIYPDDILCKISNL